MHTHRRFAPLMVLALLASALIVPVSFAQETTLQPFEPSRVRNPAPGVQYVPGQVLVRMRDGAQFTTQGVANIVALQTHFSALKLRTAKVVAPHTFRLEVAQNADVQALAQQIASDPAVLYAQPNHQYGLLRTVNDPLSTFQYALGKMNAYGAWDVSTGSSNVTLAIVDTGINRNHPEFAGRVLPGYDFANNDADPNDDEGHGTHVAGIAAAAGDNGEGIAGMCWQCQILPIKVFNSRGMASDEWVASGIRFAADNGARVINLSLGGYGEEAPLLLEAIRYAASKNALVIAAAGNAAEEGNPVSYPAAYDEVLAVGATDDNDQRAYFSEVQPYVDVSAPGYNIPSTFGNTSVAPYVTFSGTSMATPFVTGLAGLLLSANPGLDINALRSVITSTADDVGQPGNDWEVGAGRINAGRALAAVGRPSFDPVANPNQPDVSFFPETQHTLRGTFRGFWEQNGGLAVFGFPISEEFQESTPEGTYTVQYFERNRFELHPEKAAPYNVLLGRLSDAQLQRQGRNWFTFPKGAPQDGCLFFAETEHTVCEPFLSYWKGNGLRDPQLTPDGRSLALFGLPLSEPAVELNSSGQEVVTQWFERARFEYHPANPQQYQVLLGLLGNETAKNVVIGQPSSGQTPADRCGFIPPSQNVSIKPSNCFVVLTEISLEAVGFQPGEEINFYLTAADGRTAQQDPLEANAEGRVRFDRLVVPLPPGVYGIVMQGLESGNQAVQYIKVIDR